jgi:S-formylglutathione hydrolase FrmB
MALFTIDHFSESLGLNMSCLVIVPQSARGQIGVDERRPAGDSYPTLWLLHGKSDDHSIWLRRTSIERYVAPLGLAVVMPAVHLSAYANMAYGGRYWDYISEELPALLESWLPLARDRERRYVAGLSMGGWGAMKLALNRPDRFAAAASLSGALILSLSQWLAKDRQRGNDRYFELVFGKLEGLGEGGDFPREEDRLIERVSQHLASNTPLPRLFACCGTEDFLLEDNRKSAKALRELGISLDYEEGPGAHEWAFWDGWIQRALQWMGFDIEPPELMGRPVT